MITSEVDVKTMADVELGTMVPAGHRAKNRARTRFDVFHPESGFRSSCSVTNTEEGGESIRHRHTFSQIRYYLAGRRRYGRTMVVAGTLVYIPEGTFYGPQIHEEANTQLSFQFPGFGATSLYFPSVERKRALAALQQAGVRFEDGVAKFPDGTKREPTEAIFEYLHGGKLPYSPARYEEPIFIRSENFPWQQTARPKVFTKHLAYFNDGGPNVTLLRLEPGATVPGGRSGWIDIRAVFSGGVEYAGKSCPALSRLFFPPGISFDEMTSASGAELLIFQLAVPGSEAPPLRVV
jgi:hypothetical protein